MHSHRSRTSKTLCFATLVVMTFTTITLIGSNPSRYAFAHQGESFGPACGVATIDGEVKATEWSGASSHTFLMNSPSTSSPLTTTLRVMNGANYLYLGITIADDEFSTIAQFLDRGDNFRIDFDNDHSGSIFTLEDDVLSIWAGSPQFSDDYIKGNPVPESSDADVNGGGTNNGAGAASRVNNLNHFEVRHPLFSGDSLDFSLQAGNTVGFRLEYLDAEANGTIGGSYLYPGSANTSVADIVVGTCSNPDFFNYLPLIRK